jgi:hypothetical protein
LEAPTHHRPWLITPLPNSENHHSLQNSSQSSNQIGKIRLSESCFYTAEFGYVREGCGGYKWFARGFWAALGTSSTLIVPAKIGHPKKRQLASMRRNMCQKKFGIVLPTGIGKNR